MSVILASVRSEDVEHSVCIDLLAIGNWKDEGECVSYVERYFVLVNCYLE